jgi:hypothetical protein
VIEEFSDALCSLFWPLIRAWSLLRALAGQRISASLGTSTRLEGVAALTHGYSITSLRDLENHRVTIEDLSLHLGWTIMATSLVFNRTLREFAFRFLFPSGFE